MQAGLPVLGRINPGNDLMDIIKGHEIGMAYAGENVEEFLTIADQLVSDSHIRSRMSASCKIKVAELFSATVACKQISQALKS